ncbi:MAG: hypothetical protein JNM90_03945, partial [Burkholderiales bacterium]|nr:hypothetical protein [Burkholderiales bacterium]
MTIALSQGTLDQLQILRQQGAFSAAYNLLAEAARQYADNPGLADGAEDAARYTARWLDYAAHINADDGSFWSNFVRSATIDAAAARNIILTSEEFQAASDALADAVLGRVIGLGAIPNHKEIIDQDVQNAVERLSLEPKDWAGTLGATWFLDYDSWKFLTPADAPRIFMLNLGAFAQAWSAGPVVVNTSDLEFPGMTPHSNAFYVDARDWHPYRRDPLTLDLDNDGLEARVSNTFFGVQFDHDGDGATTGSGWISADDGFLVRDRNGNGSIDDGTELYGDATALPGGGTARNGFEALAAED